MSHRITSLANCDQQFILEAAETLLDSFKLDGHNIHRICAGFASTDCLGELATLRLAEQVNRTYTELVDYTEAYEPMLIAVSRQGERYIRGIRD